MRQFIIDQEHILTDKSPAFVIAEIGHNHEGDPAQAIVLIFSAYECGCHAAKFQKRDNKTLYTKAEYEKPYDNENSFGKTYGEHREALELPIEKHKFLKQYADSLGITYFATPFDLISLRALVDIGVKIIKVASADLYSIPFLRAIGETGLPVILSTGGATMKDIKTALKAIGHSNVAILHCVATYPTKAEECNTLCIQTLRKEFPDNVIGLSDHYPGILSALVARLCGAGIIEKHFRDAWWPRGTDAQYSLDTHKMKDLIDSLSAMDKMPGDGIKARHLFEDEALRKMGKGIYTMRRIEKGETISEENVSLKSPADGIPASRWDDVIGKKALCTIEEEAAMDWRMLDGDLTITVAPSKIDTKGIL